jgi:hypothetical protein
MLSCDLTNSFFIAFATIDSSLREYQVDYSDRLWSLEW